MSESYVCLVAIFCWLSGFMIGSLTPLWDWLMLKLWQLFEPKLIHGYTQDEWDEFNRKHREK